MFACFELPVRKMSEMESSKETGCRAPEGPILCINSCGFFGSAATMNMCSKCHKDTILKQEHAKIAAASIENIVNGSSNSDEKEPVLVRATNAQAISAELKVASSHITSQISEVKPKEGSNKCIACRKRVGLTGFNCKCSNLFCAVHRYSDKHDCPFDYRNAGQNAIAKANPVVVAEKLNKI